MAYVKISDPSIIDLSAWHQVINVVNQHSDSIDAITNNFGVGSTTPDWNATDYTHAYQPGSQQILYGRAKITVSDTNDGTHWYKSVTFSDTSGITAFSAQPVVTATIFAGSTSNPVSNSDDDIAVSVYNVTATGFKYRLVRTNANGTTAHPKAITGTVYVNWTAIGPR
jgi:hypothetical protein